MEFLKICFVVGNPTVEKLLVRMDYLPDQRRVVVALGNIEFPSCFPPGNEAISCLFIPAYSCLIADLSPLPEEVEDYSNTYNRKTNYGKHNTLTNMPIPKREYHIDLFVKNGNLTTDTQMGEKEIVKTIKKVR